MIIIGLFIIPIISLLAMSDSSYQSTLFVFVLMLAIINVNAYDTKKKLGN